jgi:hypothetical protein
LYYVALTRKPQDTSNALYFTTDNTLVYWNFFLDFGPLNLGQTYRFCELLNRLLAAPEHKNKVIYYYSSTHSHRRTNSVTLMTAWALIYLGRTPEEAFAPFEDAYPAFPPFHDASPCVCSYKLTIRTSPTPPFPSLPPLSIGWTCYYFIYFSLDFLPKTKHLAWQSTDFSSSSSFFFFLLLLPLFSSLLLPHHACSCSLWCTRLLTVDCLRGIKKAMDCGFVDFNNFNIEEFEHFEKVENGDLTWLSHRTCAFAGPHNTHSSSVEGYYTLTPEDYVPHFKKRGVGMVIRLNKKYYDEGRFTREGIQHRDLYYLDGSTPTEEVLQTFLGIMEAVDPSHKIAVHCKAGLGRTGSCIGAYWVCL